MRKYLSTLLLVSVLAVLLGEHVLEAGRNGTGTFTVLHSASPGSTISSSDYNANFTDVATEITNSLPRDGQAGMSGVFKAADGTATAPGLSWTADTNTGFYRSGADTMVAVAGGTAVATFSGSGLTINGTLNGGNLATTPVGVVFHTASSDVPSGYLAADGSNVDRTTYSDLFTAIGTTYGVGDGSTTFGLPDCTGRVIAGKESSATRLTSAVSGINGASLGAVGGSQSETIALANLPATNLSVSAITGSVGTSISNGTTVTRNFDYNHISNNGAGGGGNAVTSVSWTDSTLSLASGTVTFGGHVALGGSDTALATVQPTIVFNCIIKY